MAKVLIVEDDQALCATLTQCLKQQKFSVDIVHSGEHALEHVQSFEYDAIILDWNLPVLSGPEVCKRFRAGGGSTPILMLTGKDAIRDKEEGFHAGADDYLTKPFHSQELIARLHALMRRPPAYSGNSLRVRDLVMDTHKRKVTRDNNEIQLQPMEFTLLEFLMRHAGEVFSSEVLMRRCWSADAEVSLDAIYTCIRRLRKKLDVEGKPSLINTVHGIGYGLDVDAD